jgi:NUMOD4 motif/HNH endonuclease
VLERQCEIGIVEVWADIAGYEGRYQVSTLGRVKSLARVRKGKSNCSVPVAEKVMKLYTKKANGRQRPYVEVCLRKGDVRTVNGKQKLVHRLVADAFIKKLEADEQVDHINGIHNDNRVENLRVMKTIEHARLHPIVVNPLPRNQATGQFLSRGI